MTSARWLFAYVVLAACGGASANAPPSSQSALLGKAAPTFKREAVDGNPVEVGGNGTAGKVVVVKFAAKYCQPCVKTLPAIEKLHTAHPEIVIVGISEDERSSDARSLVQTYGLTFPMVHDAEQVLAARYRVHELPVTYVLDGHGNVAWVGGPDRTENEIISAIEATKP